MTHHGIATRRMISLWLPRFATDRRTCRQRPGSGNPAAPAEPLALVETAGGQVRLAAVNAIAEVEGLRPGMPLTDARAMCPRLRVAGHESEGDRRALLRLAEWCGRYTPAVALCSTAEGRAEGIGGSAGLMLDVTGCAHLFAPDASPAMREREGEEALLADLVSRLGQLGFHARAGVAETPGAAWAVARFATEARAPWVRVPERSATEALAPLPVAALRLGESNIALMRRLGLVTVGDLLSIPVAALEPRFGPQVALRLAQALGRESEALSLLHPVPPQNVRLVFAEAIAASEDMARALDRLLSALCRKLEKAHEGARRLELSAYRVDGTVHRLRLGTSRPSRDNDHLRRLFASHLDKIDPGFGIEALSLAATVSETLKPSQLALRKGARGHVRSEPEVAAERGESGVAALLDRLASRLGADAVLHASPRESYLPERMVAWRAPLALSPADSRRRVPEKTGWRSGAQASTVPRPVRLLPRPEPIDVTALLPDHPPARFRWRRLDHTVLRAEGPERLSPEWWRLDRGPGSRRGRDYFRVEDVAGRRYWIYRRHGGRKPSRWFLHGLLP